MPLKASGSAIAITMPQNIRVKSSRRTGSISVSRRSMTHVVWIHTHQSAKMKSTASAAMPKLQSSERVSES